MTHSTDQRIQMKAYEIWLLEGRPEGREARHWEMAKEFIAREETRSALLLRGSGAEPVEQTASDPDSAADAPQGAVPLRKGRVSAKPEASKPH